MKVSKIPPIEPRNDESMKISDLISYLEQVKEEEGDLRVASRVWNTLEDDREYEELTKSNVHLDRTAQLEPGKVEKCLIISKTF